MLWGAANGGQLELHRSEKGGVRLVGRFPYDTETTLAPGRAERIAAGAFAAGNRCGRGYSPVERARLREALGKPGCRNADPAQHRPALELEATITPDMERASWAQDFLSAQAAGLIRGLSPGFVVAEGGEIIERSGDGLLRTITAADLFELSAVTVPAYGQAQIEARNWKPAAAPSGAALHPSSRWRWPNAAMAQKQDEADRGTVNRLELHVSGHRRADGLDQRPWRLGRADCDGSGVREPMGECIRPGRCGRRADARSPDHGAHCQVMRLARQVGHADQQKNLVPCHDWDLTTKDGQPRAYRLNIAEAGGGRAVTALAQEVIHLKIGVVPAAPWAGVSPLRRASL